MANPRFQSNGVDLMIDGLMAAGEIAGDIRERMWQVAWARGYQDVVVPVPVPDVRIDGLLRADAALLSSPHDGAGRRRRAAHRAGRSNRRTAAGRQGAHAAALRHLGALGLQGAGHARLRASDSFRRRPCRLGLDRPPQELPERDPRGRSRAPAADRDRPRQHRVRASADAVPRRDGASRQRDPRPGHRRRLHRRRSQRCWRGPRTIRPKSPR